MVTNIDEMLDVFHRFGHDIGQVEMARNVNDVEETRFDAFTDAISSHLMVAEVFGGCTFAPIYARAIIIIVEIMSDVHVAYSCLIYVILIIDPIKVYSILMMSSIVIPNMVYHSTTNYPE